MSRPVKEGLKLLRSAVKKLKEREGLLSTFKSFSWLMGEKFVTLGVAIFVNIPMARYLGPDQFGIWNYILSVAALVAPFATLGLSNLVTKEILDNIEEEGEVLGTVMWIRKVAALFVTLLVAAFALLHSFPDRRMPFLLVVLVGATLIGNPAVFQNWFVAHYKLKAYTIANVLRTLVFAVARVLQILAGATLTEFVLLAALEAALAGVVTMIAYSRSTTNKVRWTWSASRAKSLLGKSWPLTISGLTAAVNLKLDTVLLVQLASATAAGTYAAAARLSEVWYFVPTLLMNAMFPMVLKWKYKDERLFRARTQDLLDLFAFSGTAVAVVISALSVPIVLFLYGPKYEAAAAILSIHVWSGVFIFMRALLSKWLIAEELYKFSLVTQTAGAASNVVLNLILIPRYGGIGAAVSTVVSYGASSYFSLLFHPRTRPMFGMMTIALFWPRRIPRLFSRYALRAPQA